jgi:hypothetical protein
MNKLSAFLSDHTRSSSREYVLTTRLVHDLTVAAAARGYDLLVYSPTVDSDGFDVIFDDRDRLVPIQLKAMAEGGKTKKWEIRRTLIRPKPEEADFYGFESSPSGVGRGGGVILTTAASTEDGASVDVRYAYTDIDVLSAMWLNIVPTPASSQQQKRLQRLRSELESDSEGSVELPRSAFLSATSPGSLLALAGLRSSVDQPWRVQLRKLLGKLNLQKETTISEEVLRKNIRHHLTALTSARAL